MGCYELDSSCLGSGLVEDSCERGKETWCCRKFLNRWATGGFSRRTQLRIVAMVYHKFLVRFYKNTTSKPNKLQRRPLGIYIIHDGIGTPSFQACSRGSIFSTLVQLCIWNTFIETFSVELFMAALNELMHLTWISNIRLKSIPYICLWI
jgi:hypothetical protein